MHVTESRAHQLDRFGTKCKSLGEKKLETSLFQPTDDSRKSKGKYPSFFERVEELKSLYKKHGHTNVSERENRDLAIFCRGVRNARQKTETARRKLGEERIASSDALGFDWKNNLKNNIKSFDQKIEDLSSYKEKHGHLNVRKNEDESLAGFCSSIRHARNDPGKARRMKLNEDRIASLYALGFDWRPDCTGTRKVRSIQSYHGNEP